MDDITKKHRTIRARHEAGHAVAAHVLGFTITVVDIIDGGSFGGNFKVQLPPEIEDPADWRYGPLRERVEKYNVMLAAGYVASETAVGANDRDLLYGTSRSDEKALNQDAVDAFSTPHTEPWVIDTDTPIDYQKHAILIACRHLNLQEAYKAWITERARALVNYPAYSRAIDTLTLNLLAQDTLAGPTAHAIIASAIADFTKSDKP